MNETRALAKVSTSGSQAIRAIRMSESESTCLIRPSTMNDFDAVEAFIQPFVESKWLLPRTTEELSQLLPNGYVAEVEGAIVGFAALEIYSAKMGEIRSLCVDANHQRMGIGKQLVEACIARAKERRVYEILVVTSSDEFFRRCGFDFTLPGEKKALFYVTRDAP
jgi:N-acetylglutamate synthase-like GNAT family acetyltransferase